MDGALDVWPTGFMQPIVVVTRRGTSVFEGLVVGADVYVDMVQLGT